MKAKTTKSIKIIEDNNQNTPIKCPQTSVITKKIMLTNVCSTKILPGNLPSDKQIGLTPSSKNMSIKELIAARRPKALNKCGSQKLIF